MKKQTPRRKWQKNPFAMNIALNNVSMVSEVGSANTLMRLVGHEAMDSLRRGEGTHSHLQSIIETANVAETLAKLHNLGKDWLPEIHEAQVCIHALAERGAAIGRYTMKANELKALNLLLEIHDAQLDACSVQTLGKAVEYIRQRMARNDVIVLPAIKEAA